MNEPISEITGSDRNWEEDYQLKNGKYINTCVVCGKAFLGHKMRRMCKECHSEQEQK